MRVDGTPAVDLPTANLGSAAFEAVVTTEGAADEGESEGQDQQRVS